MTSSYIYQLTFFRNNDPLQDDEIDLLRREVRRCVGEYGLHNAPYYDEYLDDSLTLEFITPFLEQFIDNMYMPFFNFLARGVKDITKMIERLNNDQTKEPIELRVHIHPEIILGEGVVV